MRDRARARGAKRRSGNGLRVSIIHFCSHFTGYFFFPNHLSGYFRNNLFFSLPFRKSGRIAERPVFRSFCRFSGVIRTGCSSSGRISGHLFSKRFIGNGSADRSANGCTANRSADGRSADCSADCLTANRSADDFSADRSADIRSNDCPDDD